MNKTDRTDAPRCTATSKGTGERCKRRPHPGTTVCVKHGAGAPQVKKKARERLQELAEPAIEALRVALEVGDIPDVIRAAVVVLDRTGYHPKTTLELSYGPDEVREVAEQLWTLCRQQLEAVAEGKSPAEADADLRAAFRAGASSEQERELVQREPRVTDRADVRAVPEVEGLPTLFDRITRLQTHRRTEKAEGATCGCPALRGDAFLSALPLDVSRRTGVCTAPNGARGRCVLRRGGRWSL